MSDEFQFKRNIKDRENNNSQGWLSWEYIHCTWALGPYDQVTRRVSLVEEELLTLPEHLSLSRF